MAWWSSWLGRPTSVREVPGSNPGATRIDGGRPQLASQGRGGLPCGSTSPRRRRSPPINGGIRPVWRERNKKRKSQTHTLHTRTLPIQSIQSGIKNNPHFKTIKMSLICPVITSVVGRATIALRNLGVGMKSTQRDFCHYFWSDHRNHGFPAGGTGLAFGVADRGTNAVRGDTLDTSGQPRPARVSLARRGSAPPGAPRLALRSSPLRAVAELRRPRPT